MNIVVARTGDSIAEVIDEINNIIGGLLVDPRPDALGTWMAKDIESISDVKEIRTTGMKEGLWVIAAVVSIEPYKVSGSTDPILPTSEPDGLPPW